MNCLLKGRQSPSTPAEAVPCFTFSKASFLSFIWIESYRLYCSNLDRTCCVRQCIRTCSIIRRGSHFRKRVFDQVLQLVGPEQSNGHIQPSAKHPCLWGKTWLSSIHEKLFELFSVTITWAADKGTHPYCKLKVGDVSLTSKCYTARLIVF